MAPADAPGVSDGPNGRPLNETVAETGPGLPDDAVAPGQLAPGDLDTAEADAQVARLKATGWASTPGGEDAPTEDAQAEAEAESEAHPT